MYKEQVIEKIDMLIYKIDEAARGTGVDVVEASSVIIALEEIKKDVDSIDIGQEVKTEQFIDGALNSIDNAFNKIKEDQNGSK